MAISSYPRTIKNGQIAANGNANAGTGLMLYNSTTGLYEAATTATFSDIKTGLATVAKQDDQVTVYSQSTNGGILNDELFDLTLSAAFQALPILLVPCKTITLINLSTNNNILYKIDLGIGTVPTLILEAGYSVKLNVLLPEYIFVKQAIDAGQKLQYIVTS
jgi:hypothetical protein